MNFQAGDRVIYLPWIAEGNRDHPDCERGKIFSLGKIGNVFVKFDQQVQKFGWLGATSESCDVRDLVKES